MTAALVGHACLSNTCALANITRQLKETAYAAKLRRPDSPRLRSSRGRVYKIGDARAFLTRSGVDADRLAQEIKDKFASAGSQ